MFRAALLSIVLTLAIGPNASLLCRAACDQPKAAGSGCDHKGPVTSASVAGDNCCDEALLGVAEFLAKDVRSDVSFANAHRATPQFASELVRPAVDARPGDKPGREWPIDQQRLKTTLRL